MLGRKFRIAYEDIRLEPVIGTALRPGKARTVLGIVYSQGRVLQPNATKL